MDGDAESRDIADWLVEQINETTRLDRLEFIGEVIADDKTLGARYANNDELVIRIRQAWSEKKKQLDVGQAEERR